MVSLEKKMFFLPNRLYAIKNNIFISFNLSVIPKDMKVKSMELHLTLIKIPNENVAYLREITSGWREEYIEKGKIPSKSKVLRTIKCIPNQNQLLIDLLTFENQWRLKDTDNYGINIVFKGRNIEYINDNPPFLIVDTV